MLQVETQGEGKRRELHERVQGLLRRNAVASRATRKTQRHREALLARLQLDSALLLGEAPSLLHFQTNYKYLKTRLVTKRKSLHTDAPNLKDASESDISTFTCHSVPIATKARYNHNQELRLLRQPWWRKLGDEYQDTKLDEELDSKLF